MDEIILNDNIKNYIYQIFCLIRYSQVSHEKLKLLKNFYKYFSESFKGGAFCTNNFFIN